MLRYSAKRLLQSLVTIFIVISVVFLLLRLMPDQMYFSGNEWGKLSPAVRLNRLKELGIYDRHGQKLNPFVQLLNFYKTLFTTFDFGKSTSLQVGKPVLGIITSKMKLSLYFGLTATVLSTILGYILGITMARRKDKWLDIAATIYITIIIATPILILYYYIQYYGTKWLNVPMIYYQSKPNSWIMPVVALVIVGIAGQAIWMRRYMVDELNKDYIKLAYAKGLSGQRIMYTHVMRNAFVPMAYGIPASFIGTLSGSFYLERLFSIPGMGNLMINAVNQHDNNVIQTIVIIYSALGVFSVFLGDILATLVDPRIKLQSEGGSR